MKRPLIDPLIASTYIANQRHAARKRAIVWFNLVAFGFLLITLAVRPSGLFGR